MFDFSGKFRLSDDARREKKLWFWFVRKVFRHRPKTTRDQEVAPEGSWLLYCNKHRGVLWREF